MYLTTSMRYGWSMRVRKLNRRSGPVRVTQGGTSKTYPHPNYGKLARKQNRYAGEDENLVDDVKEED